MHIYIYMSQVLLNPCQSPDIKHPQEAIWVNFNISLYNLNEVHFRMIPLSDHDSQGSVAVRPLQFGMNHGLIQDYTYPYAPCMVYLPFIWMMFRANVGKYTIHGASGIGWDRLCSVFLSSTDSEAVKMELQNLGKLSPPKSKNWRVLR